MFIGTYKLKVLKNRELYPNQYVSVVILHTHGADWIIILLSCKANNYIIHNNNNNNTILIKHKIAN